MGAVKLVDCVVIDGCEMVGPAFTVPDDEQGLTSTTQIRRDAYEALSTVGRAAIVAHERAHQCVEQKQHDGSVLRGTEVDCEGCVDKVAGFLLRSWGLTVDACLRGMDEAGGEYRADAAKHAVEGAKACEWLLKCEVTR